MRCIKIDIFDKTATENTFSKLNESDTEGNCFLLGTDCLGHCRGAGNAPMEIPQHHTDHQKLSVSYEIVRSKAPL